MKEIAGVTDAQIDFVEPKEEPRPKDHVVGVLDSDLRKLFFLWGQYGKRTNELFEEAVASGKSGKEDKIGEFLALREQTLLIEHLLYGSFSFAFPELLEKPSIRVRKGWKIAWAETKMSSNDMFAMVLGDFEDTSIIRNNMESGGSLPPKKSQMH